MVYNSLMTNFPQLVAELKRERDQIDQAIAAVSALTRNGSTRSASSNVSRRGPRKMSAAARARIGAAQRARWAKVKGQSGPSKTTTAKSPRRRTISAAGRRRIAAAQKARWAKARAAAK